MDIENLKAAKKKNKMTLQEIADKSGIPKRTVDQIFSGKTVNPRIDTVEAIEKALGIKPTLDWTDEDKDLGVGRHPTYLTEEEYDWLDLRSEILRIHGEGYLQTLITMLKAITKDKN